MVNRFQSLAEIFDTNQIVRIEMEECSIKKREINEKNSGL